MKLLKVVRTFVEHSGALSKLLEMMKDREAWPVAVLGIAKSDMTELLDNSSRSWDGVIFSEYKSREESSFWEKMELASLGNSRDTVSLQTPD